MYVQAKQYFNTVLEKVAGESAAMLLSFDHMQKKNFLNDLSARQLRRIFPISKQLCDKESCDLINEIVTARGYGNDF